MSKKLRNHIELLNKREFLVEEYLTNKMLDRSKRR